jgi:WhiB family redox-sensing transcriptional regulator
MLGLSGKNMVGTNWPNFDGSQPCRKVDPEIFFPEDAKELKNNLIVAKAICSTCEFESQCLEYALVHKELEGIWAGTSEKDRALMRRHPRKLAV